MEKCQPPVSMRVSGKRLILKSALLISNALFFNNFFLGQAPRRTRESNATGCAGTHTRKHTDQHVWRDACPHPLETASSALQKEVEHHETDTHHPTDVWYGRGGRSRDPDPPAPGACRR